MTDAERELTWLINLASREEWMNDQAHAEWKKCAWDKANRLAREDAERYASLPAQLAAAMKAKQQQHEPKTSGPQ